VVAKARCNVPDAKVVLLGKPKGICPNCTDDLEVKQEVTLDKPGEVILKTRRRHRLYGLPHHCRAWHREMDNACQDRGEKAITRSAF
jgi:predicted nucleic acid-binding Zn ribbon protein